MNHLPALNARWSFDTWFTGFATADYLQFKESLISDLDKLKSTACNLQNDLEKIISTIDAFEALSDRLEHLLHYLNCLFSDNPSDEAIKKERAWSATLQAEAAKIKTSLDVTLALLSNANFQEVCKSPLLKGAEYTIRCMREDGQHKMKEEMEELATDLSIDGLHAWGRLYETLSGEMKFQMKFPDGHTETVPMARRRPLMAEPDRALRKSAFEEGQKPWIEHSQTLAACLNGIAGTRLKLYKHRGISHFLQPPLFENGLKMASLEAMLEAIHQEIEIPRRALRAAAVLQGTSALHYYDLEAPQIVGPEDNSLNWKDACKIIEDSFSLAYPKLGKYFRDMLENRWIEAEPRQDKAPGAFCTVSRYKKEERVYMSFYGTLFDLVTLAHEVGHAWHSSILRSKRSFASNYPMTLAETASNFGEMILLNTLMSDPAITSSNKAYLIDQQMLRNHAYLLNIPMRYHFEKAFYEQRASGELSVSQLCDLMSKAQLDLYGDTLLADGTDPMFWAYKMHFFLTDLPFYNFPYVFGYLLSQALYARFKEEGASFLPCYEAFLAETGSASCEEVAYNTLGADLTKADFWSAAIKTIIPTLEEYEMLASAKSSKF